MNKTELDNTTKPRSVDQQQACSSRWRPVGSTREFHTHDSSVCAPHPCCVHRPSNHHMKEWPQHYREDTGVTERICPHGVGHPDPDQPWPADDWRWVHGCDGCCARTNDKDDSQSPAKNL